MVKDLMGSWSSSLFVWRPFGLSQDSLAVELVASRTFRCLGSSGGSEIQEKTLNSFIETTYFGFQVDINVAGMS